tara:strand:- start:1833 stop:2660 length:828 start_codon:yes stop_codon:yes gene_type:complete
MSDSYTIYFHVGTGKTGSTFLQKRIFPLLKEIYYIPSNRYHKIFQEIEKSLATKILVSREFDQQLEREIKSFSKKHPSTTPIIVFRRHDGYIASQYRRFVKNGFIGNFQTFFDLQNNEGYFKKSDLDYKSQVALLKKYFTKEPIVFTYKDFNENTQKFIKKWTEIMNCTIDNKKVNWSKKHTSYSEHQLKVIKKFGKLINLTKRRVFKNTILHLIWRIYLGSIRYLILHLAFLAPKNNKKLIKEEELEAVKKHFQEDWKYIQSISTSISPQTLEP